MYVVSLCNQTNKCTTHRDYIVIGVGTENQYPFGVGGSPFGTGRIICVGFASRPTGDGMLQVVENLDVDHVVGLSGLFEQLPQTIVGVVLIGEFQDWFLHFAAEPKYGGTDEAFRPFAGTNQPGGLYAGQLL